MADSASDGELTVGAIDPALGTTIAYYSSQGPTNDNRTKPDLSAASCVAGFTYATCFNGTSAATPATAGAAALVLSAGLAATPAQLKTYLLDNATVDRGAAGPDNVYGRGELVLPPPPTSRTERVSVDSAGAQGNSYSYWPSISADGRYVAFQSGASNLVPGDTNGSADIFVHDRVAGGTERVSVDSTGSQGITASGDPSISADGRYVAFESWAWNLVPGDTNGTADVFVHDRVTGATERVSVDSAGAQGGGAGGTSISADGRYVAFHSEASNLVPGDTNAVRDVFVHDRVTGTTERVSVDSAGAQGNYYSHYPSLSADGRYVAFASRASNLVPGDTNGIDDIFVHDRVTGAMERVSVDSFGAQGNNGSAWPSISAAGRYVAFGSAASNLVPGDTNATADVFVHDRVTGATERVSVDSAGVEGNGGSSPPWISADGRYVAFESRASNLVPGDTNATADIFVHDRCPDGSCSATVVPSAGGTVTAASGVGTAVVSVSFPPAALGSGSLPVTVSVLVVDPLSQPAVAGGVTALVALDLSTTPAIPSFASPVTITIPYDPAACDATCEASLGIQVYTGGIWEYLAGTVDTVNHIVSVDVMHFTPYQLVVQTTAVGGIAERADPSALPSRTSSATGQRRAGYVFGGSAVALAIVAAMVWTVRRRRRGQV